MTNRKHEPIHYITAQTFIMPLFDYASLYDFIPCSMSDSVLVCGYEWDSTWWGWNQLKGISQVESRQEIYPVAKKRHFELLETEETKTSKIKYVGAFTFIIPTKVIDKSEENYQFVICDIKEADNFSVFEWDLETQTWHGYPANGGPETDELFTEFEKQKDAYAYALKRHLDLCEMYEVTP